MSRAGDCTFVVDKACVGEENQNTAVFAKLPKARGTRISGC